MGAQFSTVDAKKLACEKFGLSVTPIAQRTHIADPAGGGTVDAQSRTAIAAILALLEAYGLTAAS